MVIYENFFCYFEVFGRNEEMCVKSNTEEKYKIRMAVKMTDFPKVNKKVT